jgi:hypothetical protein
MLMIKWCACISSEHTPLAVNYLNVSGIDTCVCHYVEVVVVSNTAIVFLSCFLAEQSLQPLQRTQKQGLLKVLILPVWYALPKFFFV